MRGGNPQRETEAPSAPAPALRPPEVQAGKEPNVMQSGAQSGSQSGTQSGTSSGTSSSTSGGAKKRVLFVCIGNSCRSQMAEAFARAYGSDILEARSAGLSPAIMVAPLTRQVLAERNVSADDQFPKGLEALEDERFDVAINLSGFPIPSLAPRTDIWPVDDPIGRKESVYRDCAARIEALVMRLILELRSA
jgi:arsenate reductase